MKKKALKRSGFAIAVAFAAVTMAGFGRNAWSEDVPPPAATDLENRVRILERKLEIADEQAAEKAKTATKASAAGDGYTFKSADGNFAFKFKALVQEDARFFVSDPNRNLTNQFLLRRVRPSIEAQFFRDYTLVVVPEFANNSATSLYDAYIDYIPTLATKFRFGKFKRPIGLENLQSDPFTLFPERAYPNSLLAARDTGVMFSGEVASGALGYNLAFMNGIGDNNFTGDTDTNDGKEGTARLYTKPFKNTNAAFVQGLHLGLGASYARQNTAGPTYRSFGQQSIFTAASGAVVDGEKVRVAPEFAWFYRSAALIGEWAQSSQVYRVGANRFRVQNQGWQAAATYVVTGEDATYTGVKPRKPFDIKAGDWGAWQLSARYEQLYLDPDNFDRGVTTSATSVQRATAYVVGVNWYLNTILRVASAYAQTEFDRGATRGDRPTEKVVTTRVQVNF